MLALYPAQFVGVTPGARTDERGASCVIRVSKLGEESLRSRVVEKVALVTRFSEPKADMLEM